MKYAHTPQERDAFAKAVSAVEGLLFTAADDAFLHDALKTEDDPNALIRNVVARALTK